MGELEAFYASRRKVTVIISLASALQYCTSQNRVYRGKSEAGAYNPFFYAAAGLSFGNFLLIGTMGCLERRALAAERAS